VYVPAGRVERTDIDIPLIGGVIRPLGNGMAEE
jgi:hypothetical protein